MDDRGNPIAGADFSPNVQDRMQVFLNTGKARSRPRMTRAVFNSVISYSGEPFLLSVRVDVEKFFAAKPHERAADTETRPGP